MFQVRSKVAAKLTIIKYSFDPNLWKNMHDTNGHYQNGHIIIKHIYIWSFKHSFWRIDHYNLAYEIPSYLYMEEEPA